MIKYRIFETDEYNRRIKKFSVREAVFIQRKLQKNVYQQLREEPHFGKNIKKLVHYTPETWRYRLGDFRLFFTIDEEKKIIFILTIEPRKNAYR